MHKIAFLALDDLHHIHHIVPIAFTLSYQQPYQCVIYLQAHCLPLVNKLGKLYPGHNCKIEVLAPSLFRKIVNCCRQTICSSSHLIHYHIARILQSDAIVTPDINLNWLVKQKKQQQQSSPKFILTFHGCGDRERSFQTIINYDLLLIAGEKRLRRLSKAGYLEHTPFAVTGCSKFDIIPADIRPQLFANNKTVVLYNPHFDLKISSWQFWGLEILKYFYQHPSYNLIFAPHCNLFHRGLSSKKIPLQYYAAENMVIDLGSEKSVDMTYTQAADIYLGDVSSQVYEFIRLPRPCVFLNPQRIEWQNNPSYANWHFGTVIDDLISLHALLAKSPLINPYVKLQEQCFADTFSITSKPAALRSAEAIMKLMDSSAKVQDELL